MFYYYSIKRIFYYSFSSFSVKNFIIFYNLHDKEIEEIMTKKYIK